MPKTDRMDERPPLKTRLLLIALVASLGLGGWYLYQSAPVEITVRFELDPSLRSGTVRAKREQLVEMELQVLSTDRRQTLVRTTKSLGAGLESPLTPPVVIRLPRGNYPTLITFRTSDGRTIIRSRVIDATGDATQRLPL